MKATRKTQPYRRAHGRPGGKTLAAMMRGKRSDGTHPKDMERQAQRNLRTLMQAPSDPRRTFSG